MDTASYGINFSVYLIEYISMIMVHQFIFIKVIQQLHANDTCMDEWM